MMTYRVGAAAGPIVSKAISEYYLSDTLRTESMRPAEYYLGREPRNESFRHREVISGRLEMGQHRAELRPDVSLALASRLGLNGQPLTQDSVANLLSVKRADGENIEGRQIHRAHTDGKKPPVGFLDLTLSAPKHLSVAWGLAPTEEEREQLLGIHRTAVQKTMQYVAEAIGYTQRGGKKNQRSEPGEIVWLGFQHYTSRPVAQDAADPQIHTHNIVLPHVLTEDGHIGALDLDYLNGRIKEFGFVYQAYVGTEARKLGIRVGMDERTGTVKFTDIPDHIVELFSKRTKEAIDKAAEHAARMGLDWGSFSDEEKVERIKGAAHEARQKKDEINDLASWSWQADEASYRYETILGKEQVAQPLSDEPVDELSKQLVTAITEALRYTDPKDQADRLIWEVDRIVYDHHERGAPTSRFAGTLMGAIEAALVSDDPGANLIEKTGDAIRQHAERVQARKDQRAAAYEAALPQLEDEYRRRAVLDALEIRTVAARAFVATGIDNAGPDLDATVAAFRRDGVDHEGQRVRLVEQDSVSIRGKERVRVTTALHVAQEQELIRLARAAAADRSSALPSERLNMTGLTEEQRRMVTQLGIGGRLAVVIGVPGSGKSTSLTPLVNAWKESGRSVYGISLAWRQASDLKDAGIGERASIAAFLKRVETGRYKLNHESVIVVDEVGLVGSRQMLELLRVRERSGAQLVMIGDPRQNQPIEGASGIELLRAALGDTTIPRLLKSIRQDSEREREIAALFRRGAAGEALEMKREDGSAILVAGGREATIRRVAELWVERTDANREDPTFRLSVSAPTNADARDIGVAIRAELQKAGQISEDVRTIQAIDRTGDTYEMKLAVGDRVRLFDRVYDPIDRRKALASNGDVVEVMQIREDGMRVRNAAGVCGLIAWNKIRSRDDGPLRLAPGYALTVDTAQGSTATEHIHALPSGSRETHGFKTYVAATRHRKASWLVIDEASERREISERAMLGHKIDITDQLVWENVAKNVARQPLKPSALSVMQHQPRQQRRAA